MKYWDFVIHSSMDVKKEVELLAQKNNCSLQVQVNHLISIGLAISNLENLSELISEIKKNLEKFEEEGEKNNEQRF